MLRSQLLPPLDWVTSYFCPALTKCDLVHSHAETFRSICLPYTRRVGCSIAALSLLQESHHITCTLTPCSQHRACRLLLINRVVTVCWLVGKLLDSWQHIIHYQRRFNQNSFFGFQLKQLYKICGSHKTFVQIVLTGKACRSVRENSFTATGVALFSPNIIYTLPFSVKPACKWNVLKILRIPTWKSRVESCRCFDGIEYCRMLNPVFHIGIRRTVLTYARANWGPPHFISKTASNMSTWKWSSLHMHTSTNVCTME